MITIEYATEDLVNLTNRYIVNNNMEFGEDEYTEFVTTLCIMRDFDARNASPAKNWDDFFSNAGNTITETNQIVRTYVVAARKFMPALCSDNMILTVSNVVDNWFKAENRVRFAYVAEQLLGIEVQQKYKAFLGDIEGESVPYSYSEDDD